jgi:hypothetical protein
MSIWSILCHTAKAENYQTTDAANNDKNSHKTCPSGDPKFMNVTFVLPSMLQTLCSEVYHAYTA